MVFQSSPAPRDGRYEAGKGQIIQASGFNPRPPRGTGATASSFDVLVLSELFQSSPAPRDGRYFALADDADLGARFNPRPPRGTGATNPR